MCTRALRCSTGARLLETGAGGSRTTAPGMEEGTPPAQAELQALRPSARRNRLLQAGATEAEVDDADDADDVLAAYVQLLLRYEPPPAPDRRASIAAELVAMKPSQRRKRALAAGATEAQVDDAEDASDVIAAYVELLESCGQPSSREEHLMAELKGMKPSKLRKRAREAGATDEEINVAADADQPLTAFVQLVARYEQNEDKVEQTKAVLTSELQAMKPSARRNRAVAAGVSLDSIETAMDADDPVAAFVELLLAHDAPSETPGTTAETARTAAFREELTGLRVGDLMRRVVSEGVNSDALEAAMDSADPKNGLIELLVARQQAGPRGRSMAALIPLTEGEAGCVDHVLNGTSSQREQGYVEIEKALARRDIAFLCTCVVPLVDVLCMDASEVDCGECQRVGVLLRKLVSDDDVTIGACFVRNDDWLRPFEASGNTLGKILAKSTADLTCADALTLAQIPFGPGGPKGIGRVLGTLGDLQAMESHWWFECYFGRFWSTPGGTPSPDRNIRISTLIMETLRRKDLSDEWEIAGAYSILTTMCQGRPDVSKHMLDLGIHELALAELSTASPIDWVSPSRDPSNRFGFAWAAAQQSTIESPMLPIDAATEHWVESGMLKASLSTLKAAEVLGDESDMHYWSIWLGIVSVLINLGTNNEDACRLVREVPGSLRWLLELEKPVDMIKVMACTSDTLIPIVCANFYGRDESGGPFTFDQETLDRALAYTTDCMSGQLAAMYPLIPNWTSVPSLNLSVSDAHKDLMLLNPKWVPHLVDGLLVDEAHVRNQPDQPTGPTDPVTLALVQTGYALALSQFAVYGPGREALLKDESVVRALELLVKTGFTEEAKDIGRRTLSALGALQSESLPQSSLGDAVDSSKPPHVMVSYNWNHQDVILRIVKWLQKRGYLVWVDTEQMKGDTVDVSLLSICFFLWVSTCS